MRRLRRTALTACALGPVLGAVLTLAGCSTPGPTSSGPSPAPAPASADPVLSASDGTAPADPALTFCGQVRANGGTGASFGPVLLTDRKQRLTKDVDAKLAAMGDVRPPTEIVEPWALQKRTLQRVEVAARQLSDDESLGDLPPTVNLRDFHGGAIDEAQDELTDYWFAHCR